MAFGGARADTRAAARGARGTVGPEQGEASKARSMDEARRCPHCASEGAVSRGMARGPVQGLRQDLQRAERYAAVGLDAGCRSGRRLKASAARCDAFLRASSIRRCSRGSCDLSWRAGRARAGWGARHGGGGGKAKKRGLSREQVPVLTREGATRQRGAAQGRGRRRSRLPSRSPCLRRRRETPCAAARNTQPLDRVRSHVQTVNSRPTFCVPVAALGRTIA